MLRKIIQKIYLAVFVCIITTLCLPCFANAATAENVVTFSVRPYYSPSQEYIAAGGSQLVASITFLNDKNDPDVKNSSPIDPWSGNLSETKETFYLEPVTNSAGELCFYAQKALDFQSGGQNNVNIRLDIFYNNGSAPLFSSQYEITVSGNNEQNPVLLRPGVTVGKYLTGQTTMDNEAMPVSVYLVSSSGEKIEVTYGTKGTPTPNPNKEGTFYLDTSALADGSYTLSVEEKVSELKTKWEKWTDRTFAEGTLCVLFSAVCSISDAVSTAATDEYIVGSTAITVSDGYAAPTATAITLNKTVVSGLDNALATAVGTMIEALNGFTGFIVNQINSLLLKTEDYVIGNADGTTVGMEPQWLVMRNIAMTLLVMALIIIAFANVLQINIEQYGLNRMIPKIIISIILAHISWLIFVFFFDMCTALQDQASQLLAAGADPMNYLSNVSISSPSAGNILGGVGALLAVLVLFVGVLICGVVLLFTLIIRIVMLAFLLAVAPLACILNIMPFSAKLYKQWWSQFFKWMFMGPLAVIILALGSTLATSATTTTGSAVAPTTITADTTGMNMMIGPLIFGAAMYFAATLPMKLGGGIMKSWSKPVTGALKTGKDAAWGATGGRFGNRIGGIFKGRSDLTKQRDSMWAAEKRAQIAKSGVGRTLITGGNKNQAAAMADAMEKNYETYYSRSDLGQLRKEYDASTNNPAKQRAIAKIAQTKFGDASKLYADPNTLTADGNWNSSNPLERDSFEKAAKASAAVNMGRLYASDRGFRNYMSTENQELSLAIAATTKDIQLAGGINSANAGKSWSQKSDKQIKQVTKDFERIAKDPTFSNDWVNIKSILTSTDTAEKRASDLMEIYKGKLDAYDAGQLVTATDLQKSWEKLGADGQRTQRTRANDKVGGAIDKFVDTVVSDLKGSAATASQSNERQAQPTQENNPINDLINAAGRDAVDSARDIFGNHRDDNQ